MTDPYQEWRALNDAFHALQSTPARTAVVELAVAARQLGPNSIALLRDMTRRLVLGVPIGDWERPPPLVAAAIEETVDAADYVTVEILRTRERLAALEAARGAVLAADAALRSVEAAETERPPAEPLLAGG